MPGAPCPSRGEAIVARAAGERDRAVAAGHGEHVVAVAALGVLGPDSQPYSASSVSVVVARTAVDRGVAGAGGELVVARSEVHDDLCRRARGSCRRRRRPARAGAVTPSSRAVRHVLARAAARAGGHAAFGHERRLEVLEVHLVRLARRGAIARAPCPRGRSSRPARSPARAARAPGSAAHASADLRVEGDLAAIGAGPGPHRHEHGQARARRSHRRPIAVASASGAAAPGPAENVPRATVSPEPALSPLAPERHRAAAARGQRALAGTRRETVLVVIRPGAPRSRRRACRAGRPPSDRRPAPHGDRRRALAGGVEPMSSSPSPPERVMPGPRCRTRDLVVAGAAVDRVRAAASCRSPRRSRPSSPSPSRMFAASATTTPESFPGPALTRGARRRRRSRTCRCRRRGRRSAAAARTPATSSAPSPVRIADRRSRRPSMPSARPRSPRRGAACPLERHGDAVVASAMITQSLGDAGSARYTSSAPSRPIVPALAVAGSASADRVSGDGETHLRLPIPVYRFAD